MWSIQKLTMETGLLWKQKTELVESYTGDIERDRFEAIDRVHGLKFILAGDDISVNAAGETEVFGSIGLAGYLIPCHEDQLYVKRVKGYRAVKTFILAAQLTCTIGISAVEEMRVNRLESRKDLKRMIGIMPVFTFAKEKRGWSSLAEHSDIRQVDYELAHSVVSRRSNGILQFGLLIRDSRFSVLRKFSECLILEDGREEIGYFLAKAGKETYEVKIIFDDHRDFRTLAYFADSPAGKLFQQLTLDKVQK